MPTTSQCPMEPCYTLEYCFYIESGPFMFNYLWDTSMWLKPNPYFSKPTHVRTENQIAWPFPQMLPIPRRNDITSQQL